MRIIFLDIDGVLNSTQRNVVLGQSSCTAKGLDPIAIGLLKFAVDCTGAKMVLSSTWKSLGFQRVAGMIEAKGWFNPPLIAQTPNSASCRRGDEIQMFLDNFDRKVTKFVCIDDSRDFNDGQTLVHIDRVLGFTVRDAIKVVNALGCRKESEKEFNGLVKSLPEES